MRKKISSSVQATNNAEEKKFVQLRLPPKLARDLEDTAKVANRKLPSEIIYRLQQGGDLVAGQPDIAAYGWVSPERDKALGDALGVLAGRIEEAGPMTGDNRAAILGMLKIAVVDVLDRLGADDAGLMDDDKAIARLEARKLANEMQRPEPSKHSQGPRPDLEIVAKLAKAWGVEGSKL